MASRFDRSFDDVRSAPFSVERQGVRSSGDLRKRPFDLRKRNRTSFAPGQVPRTRLPGPMEGGATPGGAVGGAGGGGPRSDNTAAQDIAQSVVQRAAQADVGVGPVIGTAAPTDGPAVAAAQSRSETAQQDLAQLAAQAMSPLGPSEVAAKPATGRGGSFLTGAEPGVAPEPGESAYPTQTGGPDLMALRGMTRAQRMVYYGVNDPTALYDALRADGVDESAAQWLTSDQNDPGAASAGPDLMALRAMPLDERMRQYDGVYTPEALYDALRADGVGENTARWLTDRDNDPGAGRGGGGGDDIIVPEVADTIGIDMDAAAGFWDDYYDSLEPLAKAKVKDLNENSARMYDALRREWEQTGGLGSMAARDAQGELLLGGALAEQQQNARSTFLGLYSAQADALRQKATTMASVFTTNAQLVEAARQFDVSLSVDQKQFWENIRIAERQLDEAERQYDLSRGDDREQWADQVKYWEDNLAQNQGQFDSSLTFEQEQWKDQLDQAEFDNAFAQVGVVFKLLDLLPEEIAMAGLMPLMNTVLPLLFGENILDDPLLQKALTQWDFSNRADTYLDDWRDDPTGTLADIREHYTPDGGVPTLSDEEITQVMDSLLDGEGGTAWVRDVDWSSMATRGGLTASPALQHWVADNAGSFDFGSTEGRDDAIDRIESWIEVNAPGTSNQRGAATVVFNGLRNAYNGPRETTPRT